MISEQNELLKRLSSTHFAVVELQLFLDTHPYCSEAFEEFKKQNEEYNKLVKKYEMKYGEINPAPSFGQSSYQWIKNPWPWEREAN